MENPQWYIFAKDKILIPRVSNVTYNWQVMKLLRKKIVCDRLWLKQKTKEKNWWVFKQNTWIPENKRQTMLNSQVSIWDRVTYWFEVPVGIALAVHICNCRQYLTEDDSGLLFRQAILGDYVVKQLSSWTVLQKQESHSYIWQKSLPRNGK